MNYNEAIATSILAGVAIISSKNVYKFDKDTSLTSFVLAVISMKITVIMAIHVTFGLIVCRTEY